MHPSRSKAPLHPHPCVCPWKGDKDIYKCHGSRDAIDEMNESSSSALRDHVFRLTKNSAEGPRYVHNSIWKTAHASRGICFLARRQKPCLSQREMKCLIWRLERRDLSISLISVFGGIMRFPAATKTWPKVFEKGYAQSHGDVLVQFDLYSDSKYKHT